MLETPIRADMRESVSSQLYSDEAQRISCVVSVMLAQSQEISMELVMAPSQMLPVRL